MADNRDIRSSRPILIGYKCPPKDCRYPVQSENVAGHTKDHHAFRILRPLQVFGKSRRPIVHCKEAIEGLMQAGDIEVLWGRESPEFCLFRGLLGQKHGLVNRVGHRRPGMEIGAVENAVQRRDGSDSKCQRGDGDQRKAAVL